MNRKKVMVIANDTTYTYNLRNEILERLVSDGYEVVIASHPLLFQNELRDLGCRLVPLETQRHSVNPFSNLGMLFRYRKIMLKEKPDLVLSYNIKPNVYGGIVCRLTKTHYLPNITGLGTPVENPGLMQKFSIMLYKAGVAGADCVFFQNEENRSFFEKHHMLRKGCPTHMLPGSGVSLKQHLFMPYPKSDDTIHFLFIARILKEKGIDLYLHAAEQICKRHKNVVFHICGLCDDSHYISRLQEAEKNGFILYHGEQKNLAPFFQQAHCIVHPSYYPEGMSNVLLEAAAHGRPIIATNRAGCRETVDDGKSGYIIPVKDQDALVSALERFLSLNWEQKRDMGLAGRAKIEREFDRQFVVKAYIEEIEKILH